MNDSCSSRPLVINGLLIIAFIILVSLPFLFIFDIKLTLDDSSMAKALMKSHGYIQVKIGRTTVWTKPEDAPALLMGEFMIGNDILEAKP